MSHQRRQNIDNELAVDDRPPNLLVGFPSFAEFTARDKNAAIYRKFERLSARSLLHRQSELHDLEAQVEDLDREDAKEIDNEEAQQAAVDWRYFSTHPGDQAHKRRELQANIEIKIKEYREWSFEDVYFDAHTNLLDEAIILESRVLSLSSPNNRTLRNFRRAFKPKTHSAALWDRDEQLLANERDLVALAPMDTDRLNMFLKGYFGYFFKVSNPNISKPQSTAALVMALWKVSLNAKQEKSNDTPSDLEGLYYFPERRVQAAGLVVTTILSAILLIGAIVCLLLIRKRSIRLRIGMIVLFTCLFTAVVGLLTNARRAEIFISTAAYAAVLVVFISNIDSASAD